jgi:hypothetical protein
MSAHAALLCLMNVSVRRVFYRAINKYYRNKMLPLIFYFRSCYDFILGLERGSLSLVSTTEELLDRKVAAPV